MSVIIGENEIKIFRKSFIWFYLGGGTGFIGKRLVQLLRQKGFQNIWIVSRKSDGKENTLTWVNDDEFQPSETAIKWRITAWIFTVYCRNPSSRITGCFFVRKQSSFFTLFIYFSGMTCYGDVFTPFHIVSSRFLGPKL